jgi:hypothetical protein
MTNPYDIFPEKSVWIDQLSRTVICLRIWWGPIKKHEVEILILKGVKTIEFKQVDWSVIEATIAAKTLQRCRDFDK